MNLLLHSSVREVSVPRCRVVFALVQSTVLAAATLPTGGCSSANAARIDSAAAVLYQEATSTAGRQLLADVTSAALNVGLDIASGNDSGATVAGIQGAASALRDYEGLPVAPASMTIARAAAAGSGMTHVASALIPGVEALLDNARRSISQQKLNITTDDLIEALARGFDAVADAQRAPAVH